MTHIVSKSLPQDRFVLREIYGNCLEKVGVRNNGGGYAIIDQNLIPQKVFCESYYEGDKCDDCKYFIDGRGYEYDESDCGCNGLKPLKRPPQSWCYVEEGAQ